jgi:hypothetical protein
VVVLDVDFHHRQRNAGHFLRPVGCAVRFPARRSGGVVSFFFRLQR